jgi:hypothetical protein
MLVFFAVGFGSGARAQDSISDAIKTATTPPASNALKGFFSTQIARLKKADNPSEQSVARDLLISELSPRGPGESKPPYIIAYCQAVNTAVLELMKDPAMRTRLNAGIVLAKVAEKGADLSLVDATIAVLNDKSDAVSLWGGKSARALIMPYLQSAPAGNMPMIDALVKSVKSHPKSGGLAQEALDGLAMDYTVVKLAVPVIQKAIPVQQDLLGFRVSLYTTSLPDEPGVERQAMGFLSANLKHHTPQQLEQTAQIYQDMLAVTVQHAAEGTDPERLLTIIRQSAYSMGALGPNIAQVSAKFAQVSRGSNFAALEGQLDTVHNAIAADPAYSNVKSYPKISSTATTTAPSVGPTTSTAPGTPGK